ncbi:MAG: flippase-like domain-containing protein [Bacteroidales bacterium]|nr:flippase-like domain-containing protein [Bacteroidales bacterium]
MGKSTRSFLIKLAGSAVILVLLFRFIDFDKQSFVVIFDKLNLPLYLLSLTGVALVLGVKSYRWHWIIRTEGHYYSPWKSFKAYMASFTIGVVTPGRIGEIARLYYLREEVDIDFVPSFRTIVTDRIFDLGVLFMLSFAGLIYYGQIGIHEVYTAAAIGIGLFFLGLFLAAWLLKRLLATKKPDALRPLRFVQSCVDQAVSGKALLLWLITLAAYLGFYGAIDLIFLSLGVSMPIIDIAIILSVVGLVSILPISLAGFGTREVSLVYLLAFYGITPELALSFSLLQFGAFFLWGGIIGLVFWFLMPISLDQVKQDARAVKQLLSKKKSSETI